MTDKITVERWQQIDSIFQAAVELEADERIVYLDQVCDNDHELRQSVEAMLAADPRGSRIDQSAFEVAAVLLADEQPQLTPGQTFSHYQIEKMIGKGGMGEVYLAADKLLNRKIALKLLPIDYTRDKERLRRFQQEAQAASALNHPNILTIYELREFEGRQFIATEFVEGETLRQRLQDRPLPLTEALEIAIQIASALGAAHRAGIVHRDIKPENIMLRPDGYVKVLDFGLAKLTQQDDRRFGAQVSDRLDISTGLVIGTVKYMSPEQAKGASVDARSDIFSLAVVVYEMVAGRAPFEGKTAHDLIEAILRIEPPQLLNAPLELQVLLKKALNKDKKARYQTIEHLLIDLKKLKETLEMKSKLQPSELTSTGIRPQLTAPTRNPETVNTSPSIELLFGRVRHHKTGVSLVFTALVIAATGFGYAAYRAVKRRGSPAYFQNVYVSRLTSSGHAIKPAISPDGQFIVYGNIENEKTSIWLRETRTSTEMELVPPTQDTFGGAAFSRDGRFVYLSMGTAERLNLDLGFDVYRMSVGGGARSKIIFGVSGRVSVSPDGNRLAYIRLGSSNGEIALATADKDGGDEQLIQRRKSPDGMDSAVAWNPAGTSLIYVSYPGTGPDALQRRLIEVSLADASERQISNERWEKIYEMAWLPDATGLLLTANDGFNRRQLWRVAYPSGEAKPLTNDPASYYALTISDDGRSLISEQVEEQYRIWIAPVNADDFTVDLNSARQVSDNRFDGNSSLAFSGNDKIVFSSREAGNSGIWVMDVNGQNRKQLTPLGSWFAVTPDGKYVVFTFWQLDKPNDTAHIFRIDIDGRNLKQLTAGSLENHPSVSADSKWVVYSSWESKEPTTWKVSIDGGEPIQITKTQSYGPVYSPDGNFIAYGYWTDKKEPRVAIIRSTGDAPLRTFDLGSSLLTLSWTPDGKGLSMIFPEHNGPGNLWYQPIDGGPARQLTNFTDDKLVNVAWSSDGTQLAFVRSRVVSDIVLVNDLK